jgi:hypothetical protein
MRLPMPNAWDHLPNAKHIDLVLHILKQYRKYWRTKNKDISSTSLDKAWKITYDCMTIKNRIPEWNYLYNATYGTDSRAWQADCRTSAAWLAIMALIVYDDCAYMLDSDPCELEILAKFGDERAILLLPACKAFAAIKENV